jgi:hypothetical protein
MGNASCRRFMQKDLCAPAAAPVLAGCATGGPREPGGAGCRVAVDLHDGQNMIVQPPARGGTGGLERTPGGVLGTAPRAPRVRNGVFGLPKNGDSVLSAVYARRSMR